MTYNKPIVGYVVEDYIHHHSCFIQNTVAVVAVTNMTT